MAKQIVRVRQRPGADFANHSEVNEADAPALDSATGHEEGRPEDESLSDFEAEVLDHEAGAQPLSEITGGPQGGTPDEDKDGLNEVERALRDAAEAPVGRREVGK
jgi:hypothetical protein